MTNRRDYTGKVVYMGIDVHKKTYCCVSVCEREIVKRDTMPANPEGFLNYLHKFFPEAKIKSAYEAGFSGFHLHRFLIRNGINNIVVHPASIEVSSRDRVKTDKRDAKKIAVQLSAHRLHGIHVPSEEQEAKRTVSRLRSSRLRSSRLRSSFWKARQQVGGRLKSLLFTQGLIDGTDDVRISKKWMAQKLLKIEKGNYPTDFCYTVKTYVEQWESLTLKLKEGEGQLKLQAETEREKDLQVIYKSVPGIGQIHSRELANELGDMSQFSNEKKLFSYTGLTPSEHSSGEHTRQGHITRQGRSVIRKILIEAAWVAITKDPSLREVFNRLSTQGAKRAIVGVARRLVGRIRSCLMNGILYEIHPPKEEVILQG